MNGEHLRDDGEAPSLTVAIPSWNRHTLLGETIEALAAVHGDAPLEVIVIDDGSEPPYSPGMLLRSPTRWSLSVIRTDGIGANAARNLAMETARTEWVAILDDDVYVLPGWLDALVEAQTRDEIVAVAGRITVKYEAAPPAWLDGEFFEGYLSTCDLGEGPRIGGVIPVSANCALTKTMWRELGGFFAGVDRKGASLVSGGETEFFREAERRGMKILYEPRAAVLHRFAAERLTLDYFERRAFGQGCTDAILDGGPGDLASEAGTLARSLRFNAIAEVNRLLRRRNRIEDRLWRHYARGWLSGALRHRDTRRQLRRLRSGVRRVGRLETLAAKLAAMNWHAVRLYRASRWLWLREHRAAANVLAALNRLLTGVEIPPTAEFGQGLVIMHGSGIVVHPDVRAGRDCVLYQQVTLGSTRPDGKPPTLGDGVCVFPGAKLVGEITIGDGAVIGANAFIAVDLAAGTVVRGGDARRPTRGLPSDREQMAR